MTRATESSRPSISAIMPVFNAERLLSQSLAPLLAMLARGEIDELIAVDDCSTDQSVKLLQTYRDLRLLGTPRNLGPAGARNVAAAAAISDYLWFVDSDVAVASNAARVLGMALTRGHPVAVFGSYDQAPEAQNFLSQYKNLVHRYYHQRAKAQASTFWAGCGAVQRNWFMKLGGFDVARYPYPSIEDIELGYRMIDLGALVQFEPALQGKHLKVWRFRNLLHTEIFRRAIPWSRLMLQRGKVTDDLNVSRLERLRALLAGSLVLALAGWASGLISGLWFAAAMAVALAANLQFIRYFARLRGKWFALRAFAFHQFYYLYSGAAFLYAAGGHGFDFLTRSVGR